MFPAIPPQAPMGAPMTPLGGAESQAGLPAPQPTPYDDDRTLIELLERCKKECSEQRWTYEREWLRDLFYVIGRQWILYHPTRREWLDKRIQKWIPRPASVKPFETVQSIRTVFGSIDLSVKIRPVGSDPQAIAAAEVSDQIAPLIHEEHDMAQVMREADFWLITTGNAVLQTSWDTDPRFNRTFIASEECLNCKAVLSPQAIVEAQNMCPSCGFNQFQPAVDETGEEVGEWVGVGKGKTTALSPFEYMVPSNVTRWDELPYIIRLRWRDRNWVEANYSEMAHQISWEKTSQDRSLQVFKSLASMTDGQLGTQFTSFGTTGTSASDGVTEYELWFRPNQTYKKGLVLRVLGDKSPVVVRRPQETLPGPFPFVDIEQKPLFPFVHAQYEHFGGRLLGRGALAPVIPKFDQLNQIDSYLQLCLQRVANPVWIVPEDAGIESYSGEPGWIMKWKPLAAGGNAKPERVEGSNIPPFVMTMREQVIAEIEEGTGTYDVIKGQKPTGIEAFSALQLLVERSQSRFTSVFQSRGEMYRKWFSIALELERAYGPEQRVWTALAPNRGYTFHHFENAQLQGQVTVQIEDGTNMPKTSLGKRAAVEQAFKMGIVNPMDPEQRQSLMAMFGLTDMVPTMNFHIQTAIQIQEEFEAWCQAPQGPPNLAFKLWYDPAIHYVEHIKWLNSDRMKALLRENPIGEQYITIYLQQLQMLMMPPPTQDGSEGSSGAKGGSGGGEALSNSNQNSGATSSVPSGNAQFGPMMGPV